MKKLIIFALLLTSFCAQAQEELAFPFQGGAPIMDRFFKDSLVVSPDIINKKAAGVAVIKFTADINGNISKLVIYYADDYVLTIPAIEALKKSTKKWIIPNKEKFHDFIIPFSINFNNPASGTTDMQKTAYEFYKSRRPIVARDQIPLNAATLLPTVVVKYDIQ
ncbi:hypothetical protein EWM62_18480 [Mucilaginibacter terrigena]|uniref:TonB C-terminal domain-containing protein n=1 Tax=Mucilaginibacter terrigena TaxID=2492395 RepID=A0A4Q5LH68_9SPHI|nr:hypothetical protein [Mucilaginibacter terrigena]RYU86193.1 hypothetical protein EWM62_18480 [Mucilaginibacter terrigena]